MAAREVGRVAALFRYPVKSMAAERLDTVDVGWHGFAGDRRWAFVRADMVRSGFPWLTIRERPDMCQYHSWFVEPERPNTSPTIVRTPSGRDLDVVDPELARELGEGLQHDARLIKQDRGVFDTMPLSLITVQSIAAIGASAGTTLDPRRFRPNLLIEASDDAPFQEDVWVSMVVQIGAVRMRIDKRDKRCIIVNVDPVTTERDRSVLQTIGRENDACLGVYGSTVQPGRVAVGDLVTVAV